MDLNQEYAKIKQLFRNINKEIAQQILNVLEFSGSSILRSVDLESGGYKESLKNVLILSKEMSRSIELFEANIRRIANNDTIETGSQYYITEYGGSKTQFIELIKSIIDGHVERGEPPYSMIIPVVFNGSLDLNAQTLGEKIENPTAIRLTRQLEYMRLDQKYYIDSHVFDDFMNLIVEFRKTKSTPEHLDNIFKIINELERLIDNSSGINMRISTLRKEIMQLPISDEEKLLKIVFDIMEFCSKYKIVFLFFFDECDDWLPKIEEDSKWDSDFLKKQIFFRKLYDRLKNIRLYQFYCFTPRVHEALRSEKSDLAPGVQRISSDLIKVSSSGPYVLIREQGVYQEDEAMEAILKWMVLLEKVQSPADKDIFKSFLPVLLEKINNKLSRRKANSTIISSIRSYISLTDDIKNGHQFYDSAERNPSQFITIGNIIEKVFSNYLNFLNFSFLKKHQDVGNGKWIDGKFMCLKGNETELYAEIKSFKDPSKFSFDKVGQILNCIKNTNNKAVFFLFCQGLTEEFVINKFHEWKGIGSISSDIDLDKIIPIIIENQTLLNCLVGFESVAPSRLNEKFEHFDKLLRMLNKDFHGKLINLFPAQEEKEDLEKDKEKKEEKEEKEFTYSQLLLKLKTVNDTTIRTAIEIVTNLGNISKVYSYRKTQTVKNQIKTPLLKNSFEDGLEFLKQNNVIQESNDQIKFNWELFDQSDAKNNQESLMKNIFSFILQIITKKGGIL